MKKMICFVYSDEKEKISQLLEKKYTVVFSDNLENARNIINDDAFIVVSLKMADKNTASFISLLKDYKKQQFHVLLDFNGRLSDRVLTAFIETGMNYHNFTVEQIVEKFKQLV